MVQGERPTTDNKSIIIIRKISFTKGRGGECLQVPGIEIYFHPEREEQSFLHDHHPTDRN